MRIEAEEIRCRVALATRFIDHTVQCAAEIVVAMSLEQIANVDDVGAFDWCCRYKLAMLVKYLETTHAVLLQ